MEARIESLLNKGKYFNILNNSNKTKVKLLYKKKSF